MQSTDAEEDIDFTFDEQKFVENIIAKASESEDLSDVLLEALPTISPSLLVKLRQSETSENKAIREISIKLNSLLDDQLSQAKATLRDLLNAGEINKLDNLIGKASKQGRLDVAFFNVLTANMKDAAQNGTGSKGDGVASRLQILQHIYTRCQEEVEKTLPAEVALLNKLLRTEQESIRFNLYNHYLTPQPSTIKTPDGKEVELKGPTKVLVPLEDFVAAIAKAVEQIRTVENAGATDRASAAMMVESCRQVAKEARLVIADCYGDDAKELKEFQEGLQPVFRPDSPESPYIKGIESS